MNRLIILIICLSCFFGMTACNEQNSEKTGSMLTGNQFLKKVKPYRVLLIIDEQWTDPLSYNIDTRRVNDKEFIDVVSMLQVWGVPFDILRLDEQRLNINRFLDGEARPNYGCAVWMANPDKLKGYSAHYATLKKVVEEYGISLIVLFDNIKTKEIAELAGINYHSTLRSDQAGSNGQFTITAQHYITAGAENLVLPDFNQLAPKSIPEANGISKSIIENPNGNDSFSIVSCEAADSVKVLAMAGAYPQLVVRNVSNGSKVIWIGGGKDWYLKYPVMRGIFRKSLVYSIGYGLFNDNFENGYIFIMDDIGCSEHAYSLRWHYPTPSKETLIKYLIEPLEKNGLVMVQNITTGYANPKTRMIENPWTIKPFVDTFGNYQDFGSTKEGLDEGLKRGVFEIQAHRAWSHMNWDLDSPPGPWWGPIDGELAVTDWYNEVVDVRRDAAPVPSNDLLFIYKTGIDAIQKAFDVTALSAEVRPGAELREGTKGGDDNGRIAAIAGLGISRECYVGFDRTVEFSMMMPEQFTCHDLDLTLKTGSPADTDEAGWDSLLTMTTEQLVSSKIAGGRRINLTDNTDWIDSHKDKYWMGFNECCAYLHTKIYNSNKDELCIKIYYDSHYCEYFKKKNSRWTLEISDEYLEQNGKNAVILVDGKKMNARLSTKQLLDIPDGLGKHKVEIIADK